MADPEESSQPRWAGVNGISRALLSCLSSFSSPAPSRLPSRPRPQDCRHLLSNCLVINRLYKAYVKIIITLKSQVPFQTPADTRKKTGGNSLGDKNCSTGLGWPELRDLWASGLEFRVNPIPFPLMGNPLSYGAMTESRLGH